MVRGLDTFARFFADDEARYVLIGGVATYLMLEDAGLPARATKDLDIVLIVEALDADFGAKLWKFIRRGGYEVREFGESGHNFYRFAKPSDPAFPLMLEFFARAPGVLPLAPDSHLTPVPFEHQVQSLSAILLNADYYRFLHAHTFRLAGVNVVTEKALIPLKARAWLDLSERRAADATAVDSRDINKHRNDVLRLSQLLTDSERIHVPPGIANDVGRFALAVEAGLSPDLLKQFGIDETPGALLARLCASFGVIAQ